MLLKRMLLDKLYNIEIEVNSNSMSIDEIYKKMKKIEKDIKELTEKKRAKKEEK